MSYSPMQFKRTGWYQRVVNAASALSFHWLCRRDDFQTVQGKCLPWVTAGLCLFQPRERHSALVCECFCSCVCMCVSEDKHHSPTFFCTYTPTHTPNSKPDPQALSWLDLVHDTTMLLMQEVTVKCRTLQGSQARKSYIF